MNVKDVAPRYFRTPAELRRWLERNHASEPELVIGVYKVGHADRGITYAQLMDELLAYGWIDSVTHGIDASSYKIRCTPRKAKSGWSRINLDKVERLIAEGRMTPAGMAAYQARDPELTRRAAFKASPSDLPEGLLRKFRANEAAWKYFEASAPSYQRIVSAWILSAKREETRERRLQQLIDCSAAGKRIPQVLERPPKGRIPSGRSA